MVLQTGLKDIALCQKKQQIDQQNKNPTIDNWETVPERRGTCRVHPGERRPGICSRTTAVTEVVNDTKLKWTPGRALPPLQKPNKGHCWCYPYRTSGNMGTWKVKSWTDVTTRDQMVWRMSKHSLNSKSVMTRSLRSLTKSGHSWAPPGSQTRPSENMSKILKARILSQNPKQKWQNFRLYS